MNRKEGPLTPYLIIFCTVPDKESGIKISKALLKSRLAACVNSVSDVNSMYWWNQNIEQDKERLLIIKTRRDLYADLEKTIKNIHPYDVPEIVALPVAAGSASYLEWIKSETEPGSST